MDTAYHFPLFDNVVPQPFGGIQINLSEIIPWTEFVSTFGDIRLTPSTDVVDHPVGRTEVRAGESAGFTGR
jgi:hypothetical protein